MRHVSPVFAGLNFSDGDFDPDEAPTALLTAATTNAGFLSKVLVNP